MTTTVNAVNITDMLTVLFLGHRTGVPKIAVVITDGNSANRAQTFAEAKKARASGIQVIAIGVGHGINQKELEGIASSPKSQYVYNAENFDVLNTLQASLSSKTCEGIYGLYTVVKFYILHISFIFVVPIQRE
jgi:hypothetical protein